MILTKTPLRISFFGGGSDMPEFYTSNPGAVLSAAINKYMYIAVNRTPKNIIKANYDQVEVVDCIDDLKHDRIRESLRYYEVYNGVEISSFCEMPTKGTGLGSSSTYTVGLCKALSDITGSEDTKYDLAETAYLIERDMCGDKLGKQDQYAAAYGGLNLIEYYQDSSSVLSVGINSNTMRDLRNNLLMVFTGVRRNSNDILSKQAENLKDEKSATKALSQMVDMAYDAHGYLKNGRLDDFGKLLGESWKLKRSLSENISNSDIDEMYERAMKVGALGGKILGAGGGGFLLFYVKPKHRDKLIHEFSDFTIFDDFDFSQTGTETVYNDRARW